VTAAAWWKTGVFYQIYPRSFADSTGSGVGDLPGITQRLDHLAWLGVDALWISPFFPSPMRDFGYDVADYCGVDPLFGTLADFDALVAAAHERGLRVIIDWVPAHTSSDHPWFVDARSSKSSSRRSWYVWRDPAPGGGPPNNWTSTFTQGAPAWTLDAASGQYYLHSFLSEMPDLDWNEPAVVEAMHAVLRFWLERGVDGFRADVIHNIGKDPALADVAEKVAPIPHSALNDDALTHGHLREIRRLLDAWPGERMMVGEVFLLSTERVASYYGKDDELQLCFNFPPLFAEWDAERWRRCLEDTLKATGPIGAWPTWVLSNHDFPRHRTRYGGSEARARAAAVLLLTLAGTPFVYMGEELGLEDATVPEERQVDPGGRDGCRSPFPWSADTRRDWGAEPWLPFPPDLAKRNVEAQRRDPASILHLYRRLLSVRRSSPALSSGEIELLRGAEPLLAYRRFSAHDERTIFINFGDDAVPWEGAARQLVELASDGVGEGGAYTGEVGADCAVILRRIG
jgi:alpha-glucosidase